MSTEANKKRIVVAGGSGMIGGHLCPYLATLGHEVVVLTRNPSRHNGNGVSYVQWDPSSPGPWRQELERAFAVINLCGETIAGKRWTEKRKAELIRSRTLPSQALVDAIDTLSVPPLVFLQASGVGYYGIGEDDKSENSPMGSDFLARLAAEWEAPLKALTIRHVAMRLGVVLSVEGGALPQMLLPIRAFVGGKIAGGRQWFSWVHVRDVIKAIEFMLHDDRMHGPVNIVAPGCVRNVTFTQVAGRVLKRPTLFALPRLVMSVLLGEQATLICDGQRVKPARLSEAGFRFSFAEIEPALLDLLSRNKKRPA